MVSKLRIIWKQTVEDAILWKQATLHTAEEIAERQLHQSQQPERQPKHGAGQHMTRATDRYPENEAFPRERDGAVGFEVEGMRQFMDHGYYLRPETIESLFYFSRLGGDADSRGSEPRSATANETTGAFPYNP